MENSEFKKVLKEINSGFYENKKIIDDAIKEELTKGNSINKEKLEEIFKNFDIISNEEHNLENKNIAVYYSGRPEVTLTYILDSIIYNNKITICTEEYNIINEVLITIILESIKKCKFKNEWIDYKTDYNEIYLRNNQNSFDKIIYIGDYFEYEKFRFFFKTTVEYNNYGYIKIFLDKSKYKDEYKKIIKYTYIENIYLEVYDDIQECIEESKEVDFIVVYIEDAKIADKFQKELNAEKILINKFPYDYKFEVKR